MNRNVLSFLVGILVIVPVSSPRNSQANPSCYGCALLDPPGCFVCELGGTYKKCAVTCHTCAASQPCPPGELDCFLSGTPITTPLGRTSIEALRAGDKVLSRAADGQLIESTVQRTIKVVHDTGFVVINGTLRVSHLHKLALEEGSARATVAMAAAGNWVEATEITVGDKLLGINGEAIIVESVEHVNKGVRVYDIDVSPGTNFFAAGYLVADMHQ